MSAATFVWNGQYVVNRTVVFNHAAVKLVAAAPQGGFFAGPPHHLAELARRWCRLIFDFICKGGVTLTRLTNPARRNQSHRQREFQR
jgi:hypothetical protein